MGTEIENETSVRTRTGATAQSLRLQNQRLGAAGSSGRSRCQPGQSATHHDHVPRLFHGRLLVFVVSYQIDGVGPRLVTATPVAESTR